MIIGKKSKVLVATFSPWKDGARLPTNGMVEPFIRYFSKRADDFVLIDQPHPGSDMVLPRIECYKKGKLVGIKNNSFIVSLLLPILAITNSHKTQITFKIRDFLSVCDWVVGQGKSIDVFIGFESVNALAGILLKKLGLVKTVVYYVSDFSPRRYKGNWFNKLYLVLDKISTTHADATWNVSPAMSEARKKLGYNMAKISPQIYAPNAFFKEEIKQLPLKGIKPFSIIYAGTLGPENGPQIAIQVLKEIIKKFPGATLTIAGGGTRKDEESLKGLTKKLKLEKNIFFRGFVPTNKELYDLVRHHAISIAPYRAIPNSVRWYADAVKIRMSLACGVPVVTTKVPPMGKEAERFGAAISTKDNPHDLAKAVIEIFSHKNKYLKMRRSAITAAKENTWENSYSNALMRTGHLV